MQSKLPHRNLDEQISRDQPENTNIATGGKQKRNTSWLELFLRGYFHFIDLKKKVKILGHFNI